MSVPPKRRTLTTLALGSLALLAAACGRKEDGIGAPLKVAFVYAGPIGDAGWSYAHDLGRRGLEAHFGPRIKTTVVENVVEDADAERVFRELASDGHRIIFGTSFGFMDAMLRVARDYPDVKFEHATGHKTAPNLATYDAKTFGAAYLAGLIAGSMTRSHRLGVVAPRPIPETLRNINAFTIGARQVNPKAETLVQWIPSWYDPPRERDAALALIGDGADMLMHFTDSPATLQAAEERRVFGFGWDADMSKRAPRAHLASAVINWTPYYVHAVQAVLNGTWKSTQTWWGAVEGVIDLASISPAVPDTVRKLVAEKQAAMASGTSVIFTGPLYDQQGREVIVTGQVANESMLKSMDFLVRGVRGTIPK